MNLKTVSFSILSAFVLFFGGVSFAKADEPLMHVLLPGVGRWTPVYMCLIDWNPSWDTSKIGTGACVLEGRALPGQGNALLAGHDYGDFGHLYNVKIDQMIYLSQGGHTSSYKVARTLFSPQFARDLIISDENRLVLFTSAANNRRLVVIAYPHLQ